MRRTTAQEHRSIAISEKMAMYEHNNATFDVLNLIDRFTTKELLGHLERTVSTERYRRMYLPMLERFVERIGDLPLSPVVYSEIGGCILAGVQAGSLAVATCDTTIFAPSATSAQRMTDDVIWKWLAFCSTLANCYLICAANVVVTDLDSKDEYSFADDSHLTELKNLKAVWASQPTVSTNKLMPYLFCFFYPGQFAHLDRHMVGELGLSINPSLVQKAAETQLSRVVRSSIQKVLADEKSRGSVAIAGKPINPEDVTLHAKAIEQSGSQSTTPAVASPAPAQSATFSPFQGQEEEEEEKEEVPKDVETPAMKLAKEYIASLPRMKAIKEGITEVGTTQVIVDNQMLGHGTERQRTFEILKNAGYILRREEKSIVLNEKAAAIYHEAARRNAEKSAEADGVTQ